MQDDHDLFIEFYEKYKNKLFSYLMYRLNFNRELSEDLLMDVVLKGYEKFGSYNQKKGSFKNWIFAIAHNHLLNHWRDQNMQKTVDIEAVQLNEKFAVEERSSEKANKEIERECIQKVFELMNDKNSELLTLKYINDFNNKEIAKILKKREGAVRTGLSRAVKEFEELYKKLYNN
ncbi:RNA polymerase sigma factor [Patescibacteria group bacterium]